MTPFWSAWVMLLIVLNLGIAFLLFLWAPRVKIPVQEDGTSGHVWAHGVLREGIRQLPAWWLAGSALVFLLGFGYLVLYPGFGSSKGVLGWTSSDELARDSAANDAKLAAVLDRVRQQPIERLAGDPIVLKAGERLFVDNCAACHGRDARGNPQLGAPDLTDHDWLYGGDGKAILASILDGRRGAMPAFGASMPDGSIVDLANYVQSLSGLPHDGPKAAAGKRLFTTCAACHGADGRGNTSLGAPNLTDSTWLYGWNLATLTKTIREGRTGVMPAWRSRLGEDRVRVVAAWVYAQSQPGMRASQ